MNAECSGRSGETFGVSQQDFCFKLLLSNQKNKQTAFWRENLSHRLNIIQLQQQQAIGNLYKGPKETGLHCPSLHEATKV